MHQRIRTIAALKSYCEKFVSEHASLLEKMDEARAEGTLRHFLRFNCAHLHVVTVYADEASRYIKFVTEECEEDGALMSDDRKLEIVKEETHRRVNNMSMRITNRSTSISANLDEDAERAFWIELYQALEGGY